MRSAHRNGPSPQKAACSKEDRGETHRNRFKTGLFFRVQDQTTLWIILLPSLTATPPLPPAFMNSRVLMYLARWGGMWKGGTTPVIHPGSSVPLSGWKFIFVSLLSFSHCGQRHVSFEFIQVEVSRSLIRLPSVFLCSGRKKRQIYHHVQAQ